MKKRYKPRARRIRYNDHSYQNWRGNATDIKARRKWIFKTFGDGKTCKCVKCGKKLTEKTMTVDRIIPGCKGGRYNHANIQPMCLEDNMKKGFKECGKNVAPFNNNPRRKKYAVRSWRTMKFKHKRSAA